MSFGPQRARILVSSDSEGAADTFAAVAEVEEFFDITTSIDLPANPQARWVQIRIEEGKQANNIQLNEVEFYDASGSRIVATATSEDLRFRIPIQIVLRLDADDLAEAGIPASTPMGAFAWHPQAQEWQWSRQSSVDSDALNSDDESTLFLLDLNYLSPIAVFAMAHATEPGSGLDARWSLNPFSPNGDGVADTSRLFIRTETDGFSAGAAADAGEVTVRLYDRRGMLVRTLAERAVVVSGALTLEWDGRDRSDRMVAVGVYVYEVQFTPTQGADGAAVYNGLIAVAR